MKKKITIISIIFLVILIINGNYSFAGYNASNKTVNSSSTVSINISSTDKLQNYDVSLINAGGLEYVSCSATPDNGFPVVNSKDGKISYMSTEAGVKSLGDFTFKAPTVSEDKVYTISFNVNGQTIYSKVTVKAPEPPKTEETTPEQSETPEPPQGLKGDTPTPVKSSNSYLKSLKLSTGSINFNKKTTKYTLDVAEEVESITITAVADDEKASVSGSGKINLVKGTNTVKVIVTAESGSQRPYTLTIVRAGTEEPEEEVPEETPVEEIVGLTSLSLKGIKDNGDVLDLKFTPEFATDTFYYKCDVPYDINNIDVDSTCDILDAIIEITGNENLHDGENLINIIIKYMTEAGEEKTVTYQIEVNKLANAVQTISEEEIPESNKIFIVFLIIPVICLIIAIILIVRYKKQNKDQWQETEFGTYGKPLYDENEPEQERESVLEQEVVESSEEQQERQENEVIDIVEENKKARKKKKGKHF